MDKTKKSLIALVSILALCTTTSVLAQPAQFMIYGHVFYENSSEYNNIPCVSITNQNTNEEWQAETNAVYYQPIFANGTNVNISEVLQFEVKSPNGCQSKVFNHTINEGEVNNGEFFKFNIPPYMAIPPSITSWYPIETVVNNTAGEPRTFKVAANQTVNVTWYVNGSIVHTNTSVPAGTSAIYTNESAAEGTWNVSAVVENVNGKDMHTWTWKAYVLDLTTIELKPSTANLTVNKTQHFTATAYDQYNQPMPGINITWTSSNETVGTVSPSWSITGPEGTATTTSYALAEGTTYVIAYNGTVFDSATVNVTAAPPVYGVNLTVDEEAKTTAEDVNATYILTVNNTGNARDTFVLAVVDNPDNATIAELNRTQVTLNALKTGIVLLNVTNATVEEEEMFRVNVTATSQGNSSVFDYVNTTTTVEPKQWGVNLTVDEETKTTAEDVNVTYILTVNNTGNARDTFVLAVVDNPDNATIAELNRTQVTLNALRTGIVLLNVTNATVAEEEMFRINVTATSQGNSSVFDYVNTTTTVYKPEVTTIEVEPPEALIPEGGTEQFIATAYDQYDKKMPDEEFTWSVSNETVGTVNETGFFEALAAGDTLVNATADNVNGTAIVTVVRYGVELSVDKDKQDVYTSETATYTLTVKNKGNVEDTINLSQEGIGTLSKSSVTLAKDKSTTVTLKVSSSSTGTYTTKVTATSQGDTSKSASVTVTTTVKRYYGGGGGGAGRARPTPIPTPIPTPTPSLSEIIDEELKKLSIGQIVFNPPRNMTVGKKERIEVRITQNITENLTEGLIGRGVPVVEAIKVSRFMKVRLTGDNFDIKRLFIDEEQIVGSEGFTQWAWDVTPLKSGVQVLHLFVAVRIGEGKKDYPVVDKRIYVEVNSVGDNEEIPWWEHPIVTLIIVGIIVATIAGLLVHIITQMPWIFSKTWEKIKEKIGKKIMRFVSYLKRQ